MGKPVEIDLATLTVGLVWGSIWLTLAAIRALGRKSAYVARVVEGRKLVTDGPYRVIGNPIYTGMLGMLLGTGLAVSRIWAILVAVVFYALGTAIRVRCEEKLLREAFG